jgi:lipopolysaccharide biosynthesis protein
MDKIRPIAIHLPQFHPTPENDDWWGKGFTEWTNVTKSKPLYKDHYQPQLPSDLGFYDLRLEEARLAQEQMAKHFGIHGFCYYHYWFNGKLILEEPVSRKLNNPKEDLPFMLCWANENWTRRWDGKDQEVLLKQDYSLNDDAEHIKYLIPFFKDERYIKVNGKAVFLVYKPFLFPNSKETTKIWRDIAAQNGVELYLCHCVFSYHKGWENLLDGFDAVVDFEPFGIRRTSVFSEMKKQRDSKYKNNIQTRIINKIKNVVGITNTTTNYVLNKWDYKWMTTNLKPLKDFPYKIFPNLVPGWDNTARRKNVPTLILDNSTPDLFEDWLTNVVNDFKPYSPEENFIFINAWNEWAEGNHLEPCQKWGTAYLERLQKVLSKN